MVTMSTLPVRSPLPNRHPSTRSAPAISASSAAATPVPRSLCGCTDSTTLSRLAMLRCIHSIMSANTLGVECSTVVGRLMMQGCAGVGCQTAVTASMTRLENASSVPEKCSGEYWKVHCVPDCWRAKSLISFAWLVASSTIWSSSMPSTTLRMTGDVALYTWTMARLAPTTASIVR